MPNYLENMDVEQLDYFERYSKTEKKNDCDKLHDTI